MPALRILLFQFLFRFVRPHPRITAAAILLLLLSPLPLLLHTIHTLRTSEQHTTPPLTITHGGTGQAMLPAHTMIIGNGTTIHGDCTACPPFTPDPAKCCILHFNGQGPL